MTTNADITLFNKVYDRTTRSESFVPTVIRGVSFYMAVSSSSGKKQQEKSVKATITIPLKADTSGKNYVESMMYKTLGKEGVSNVWTLQIGDLIVPHIAGNIEIYSETDLWRRFDDVIVIREFADNTTRGSDYIRHWRIGGM